MSKPKNMTPQEEAEWKERRRKYLREYGNRPDAKKKAKARNDRYRDKPGIRERDSRVALRNRETDPDRKRQKREYNKNWMRERYQAKRIELEFDHFMARIEGEAADAD